MISGIITYFIIALIEFIWVWTFAKRNLDEITTGELLLGVIGSLTIIFIPLIVSLIASQYYLEKLLDKLGKMVIWRKK